MLDARLVASLRAVLRHVKGLQLQGVRVGWVSPDARPSLVCDDVEDVDLFGWHAPAALGAQSIVRFRNVRRALVHGCRSPEGAETFLRVEGKASSKIGLAANDLREARRAVDLGLEVAPDAVVKKEG